MAMAQKTLDQLKASPTATFFCIRDEDAYSLEIKNPEIRRARLCDVDLREGKFSQGFMQRVCFERCYLRNATFEAVVLTGSEFHHCNLGYATFDRCKLWYVTFMHCDLNYENLLQNLPVEQNIRMRLLRSLRLNAVSMGEPTIADTLLLLELKAERQDLLNRVVHATDYYKKFDFWRRVSASIMFAWHIVQHVIWGYGLRVRNLITTALVYVLLAAFLLGVCGATFETNFVSVGTMSFSQHLYVATVTFSTLGSSHYVPVNASGRLIVAMNSITGTLFLGLLAATVYRRIRR